MADLLDAYEKEKKPRVHVGDKIKGEIIAIGKDTVFVDTGTKIDGVVEIEELLDAERNLNYKVGGYARALCDIHPLQRHHPFTGHFRHRRRPYP